MNEITRILLVDDHPIVREGLSQMINREDDLTVCGEAGDGPMAIRSIGKLSPDMVMVDISLGSINGLELIKNIRAIAPDLLILVLSMHDEVLFAERALKAGAGGYVMKQAGVKKILEAIRLVINGELALSEHMAKRMLHSFVEGRSNADNSPTGRLSDRELAVFQLIGRGYRSQRIARELGISAKTVGAYREHIKGKLQLKDGAELVQYAIQWNQSEKII